LERKARPRSGSPQCIAANVDILDSFTVVVLVIVIIVVARTMVFTGIAAVTVQRRALSPIAPTARTGMPGSSTA